MCHAQAPVTRVGVESWSSPVQVPIETRSLSGSPSRSTGVMGCIHVICELHLTLANPRTLRISWKFNLMDFWVYAPHDPGDLEGLPDRDRDSIGTQPLPGSRGTWAWHMGSLSCSCYCSFLPLMLVQTVMVTRFTVLLLYNYVLFIKL